MRIGLLALALAAGLGLAGCNDGYGYGVGAGYGGYYDDAYAGFPAYYGWYGDYYYPGTGAYVFDRYRRPFRWNDEQRRYWEARRPGRQQGYRDNWHGFAQNGYRYQPGAGRQRPPAYRDRGYGVRAPDGAVPADAHPPAYRADRGNRPYPGQNEGWRGRGGSRPGGDGRQGEDAHQDDKGDGRQGGWHGRHR